MCLLNTAHGHVLVRSIDWMDCIQPHTVCCPMCSGNGGGKSSMSAQKPAAVAGKRSSSSAAVRLPLAVGKENV